MNKFMRIFNIMYLFLWLGLTACSGGTDISTITISDTCSLDNVLGGSGTPPLFTANINADIQFQGWVADSTKTKTPKKIKIELVNMNNLVQFAVTGDVGLKRPDVAAALKVPTLDDSGFSVLTKLQAIAPGEYDVLLVAIYVDQLTVCKSHRKILVKQ